MMGRHLVGDPRISCSSDSSSRILKKVAGLLFILTFRPVNCANSPKMDFIEHRDLVS